MKHTLKILPVYFEAVLRGEKNFEIRDNSDRGFQKGDIVVLKEFNPRRPLSNSLTRETMVEITYVTNYKQKDNYVVFGFKTFED